MMAPTIALGRDGTPRLVVGSAGSARLRGAIMQIVVNVLEHGLAVDDAIAAPRVHVDEPHVHCEGGHDPAELDRLEALGYDVVRWRRRNLFFGGAAAVEVLAGRLRSPPPATRGEAAPGVVVERERSARPPGRARATPAGARRARERRRRPSRRAGCSPTRAGEASATSGATSARSSATPTRRCSSPSSDGELVGRLSLTRDPHPASAHVADLGLMVAAAHRRRGIGTALLAAAEEWARGAGVTKLELHVFPHNDAGDRALREARLRARGARAAATTPRADGRFVDAILMAKQL